jgi:carbonic anhydrase
VRPICERKKRVFEQLSHAQQPLALCIGGSDSRVDTSLLSQP